MAANLTDVARRAGVSATLVSGFLNHRQSVRMSEETRGRIETALRELAYRPNRSARKLRTGRGHLIGVCGLGANEIGAAERRIFSQELEALNYRMIQGASSGDETLLREELLELVSYGCDGIILRQYPISEEFADFICGLECPVACLSGGAAPARLGDRLITYDNGAGIRAAMDYLHGLGHENVALVARYWSTFRSGPRAAAFREYPASSEARIRCFDTYEDITVERVTALRRELADCTAWICLNDMTALRVIQCCAEAGIRVPGDLSIIGSDDCELAAAATPALTSIHLPCREACHAVLTLLFDLLLGRSDPFDRVLPAALTIRKSCAPPAAGAVSSGKTTIHHGGVC
ncbi:MAG: LacI family DNA-binding transcriptional regulator [Lentisphaeria bacterium]|nr:LacI family DNA-binding transcriptional regulator [Lentisphaeria bacterium]